MGLRFNELPLETQMWIVPELRQYYDLITYENAGDWLVCYAYGAVTLWSSFEFHRIPENDQEFENHKLSLFKDAYSLYKISSIKDIEYVTRLKNESHRYMNYQLKGNNRINSDDICDKINEVLDENYEVYLEKEDFIMTSRFVNILSDIEPFNFLKISNLKSLRAEKVIVRLKCGLIKDLNQIEDITTIVKSKFNYDTTIIMGISKFEQKIKSEVDIFIYTNEEYIPVKVL